MAMKWGDLLFQALRDNKRDDTRQMAFHLMSTLEVCLEVADKLKGTNDPQERQLSELNNTIMGAISQCAGFIELRTEMHAEK